MKLHIAIRMGKPKATLLGSDRPLPVEDWNKGQLPHRVWFDGRELPFITEVLMDTRADESHSRVVMKFMVLREDVSTEWPEFAEDAAGPVREAGQLSELNAATYRRVIGFDPGREMLFTPGEVDRLLDAARFEGASR